MVDAILTDFPVSQHVAIGPSASGAPIKRKVVSTTSGAGDNEIVAAVTGARIRVLYFNVFGSPTAATNFRFEDGAGGTALTGVMKLQSQIQFEMTWVGCGHFETTAGNALSVEQTGSNAQLLGYIIYQEISTSD